MLRAAYIVMVVGLLSGSALMAADGADRGARLPDGAGLVLLASLQR